MNKKIREAVRVVGHLLEARGTTEAFARSKNGKPVDVTSPKACKFCLQGAIDAVTHHVLKSDPNYDLKLDTAVEDTIGINRSQFTMLWDYSDSYFHKFVVETLKNA